MNYKETLDFLYNSLPMFQKQGKTAFKKDLSNIIKLCDHLGNPHYQFKAVHIAGTNGKGSTAHSIAAILQAANYKTGLYTSPHLKDFTERIKIDGEPIAQNEVIHFVSANKAIIKEIKPSFFEMTVAMAFDFFSRQQVDIAVIEVGLGGRLDSTNIIKPLISVITNIGMDHTDMLGNSLEEIAGEKAGIIKQHTPVVISEFQPDIAPIFKAKAAQMKSDLFFADKEILIKSDDQQYVIENQQEEQIVGDIKFDLKGKFHLKNIPGIVKTVIALNSIGFKVDKEALKSGLSNAASLTNFKGRWQQLNTHPLVICDIGHNEAGVQEIVDQIKSTPFNKLHVIWGMVKDKNVDDVLRLLPIDASYYFCQAQIPRALDVNELKAKAMSYNLLGNSFNSVNHAIKNALEVADDNDMVFIGGSTFVVAEIEDL